MVCLSMDFSLINEWVHKIVVEQKQKGLTVDPVSGISVYVSTQDWENEVTAFDYGREVDNDSLIEAYTVVISYCDEIRDSYATGDYIYHGGMYVFVNSKLAYHLVGAAPFSGESAVNVPDMHVLSQKEAKQMHGDNCVLP